MSKKKCKHNRKRNQFIADKKLGTHHVFCTQCQRRVDITITQQDIDRDLNDFKERWKKDER
jgi:hypothetical protein